MKTSTKQKNFMRFWLTVSILFLATVFSFIPTAHSQSWAQDCRSQGGQVADYRVSRIKESASRADFEKAFALHVKWYRDHGYTENKMMLGDAVEMDPTSKQLGIKKEEVVAIHLNAPAIPADKRDAAWEEYVAAYRSAAELITDKKICIRSTQ